MWRTGRKVGRTIYVQFDAEPGDEDRLIGMMDNRELAAFVVAAVNAYNPLPVVTNAEEERPHQTRTR